MLGFGGWVRSEESNTHCCLANVRLALMAELSRLREERVLHLRRIELLTARVEQLSVCGVVVSLVPYGAVTHPETVPVATKRHLDDNTGASAGRGTQTVNDRIAIFPLPMLHYVYSVNCSFFRQTSRLPTKL